MPFYRLTDQKIEILINKLELASGWEPLTGNTPLMIAGTMLDLQKAISFMRKLKQQCHGMSQSQYDGHSHNFHSDNPPIVNACTPHLQPISFIMALQDFDFMWLPHHNAARIEIRTETIPP